jgi:hypothetical protein
MKATIEYVKLKFAEFNELCFEGKLKMLPFKLSVARSSLGQIRFGKEQNPDGTWHYFGFQFVISNKLDLPEREIEDTILHEMIHYYILSNQMQDTSPHGDIFIRIMKDLNVRFDRNITVSHHATKEEHDKDTELRQHIICISRRRGNQMGITIATKSSVFKLWEEISKLSNVEECNWYVTTDPYFNRYPRAKSVKIYPITRDDLEVHMENAKPLIKNGKSIRIKQ